MLKAGVGQRVQTALCCAFCPFFQLMRDRIVVNETYKMDEDVGTAMILGCCCGPCSAMQTVNEVMEREKQEFDCAGIKQVGFSDRMLHQY